MITPEMIAQDNELLERQKAEWGQGEWTNEPNRVDGTAFGFDTLLKRNTMGAWCGYVGVPEGHPVFGKSYDEIESINVHGGLTYSGACQGSICHLTDNTGKKVWWLGFDCAHSGDLAPAMEGYRKRSDWPKFPTLEGKYKTLFAETYKNLAYVKQQTEDLARQLKEMK